MNTKLVCWNHLCGIRWVGLAIGLLAAGSSSLLAGGWGHGSSVVVYYTPGPYYAPVYYPAYEGPYMLRRPNYAVSGTLLGALTGGLIGNSIHHQGWEGAGIGAAAGLLLGGLAEHHARVRERSAIAALPVMTATPQPAAVASAPPRANATAYPATPNPGANATSGNSGISGASGTSGSTAMSSANRLFGR